MNLDLRGVVLFGLISFCVLSVSWANGFFAFTRQEKNLEERNRYAPRWFHVATLFLIYFIVGSAPISIIQKIWPQFIPSISPLVMVSWGNFLMASFIALMMVSYLFLVNRNTFFSVWGQTSYRQDIKYGLIGCLIGFPCVIFLGELFDLLLYFFFSITELPEQIAVLLLKMTFGHPLHFFVTILTVIILAPLIEETLFRGYLQSFLRKHFNLSASIVISSLAFALFHYSPEQKLANIPIIGSLFVLALFLGFVYEKRQSLFASIVFHAAFNSISVFNLYLFDGR